MSDIGFKSGLGFGFGFITAEAVVGLGAIALLGTVAALAANSEKTHVGKKPAEPSAPPAEGNHG
jgi:hypothetical protein